ncbi:MAG: hypothetical protein Q9166_004065 [cf. Caloplaca sp. 2 TL-2023]
MRKNMEPALRGLKDLPDLQINDAIAQDEWRLALRLIEKREKKLKKGETNDWLAVCNLCYAITTQLTNSYAKACKASVLLMLPEPTKQRQGRTLLDSLLTRKPPVIDFNAVETIDFFSQLRAEIEPQTDALWMQAANAQPNDEELHKHWFKTRLRMRDWQGARKAAMTYTKHFPDTREPFFWTIFANHMACRSLADQDYEKNLCGTMAYRMFQKVAEAVPLGKKQELKNGRVLRTPNDILFLLDVYEWQGKFKEAIGVLEDDRTGINSRIGKRSWKLVTRKIRLLGMAEQWLKQYKYSFQLLEDARPGSNMPQSHGFGELGNDGGVWSALVDAAVRLRLPVVQLDDEDHDAESQETANRQAIAKNNFKYTQHALGALLDEYKMDRNAMCAGLRWFSKLGTEHEAMLANNAGDYFETYGHKTFCFDDLQQYVGAMQPLAIKQFLCNVEARLKMREDSVSQQSQNTPLDVDLLITKINKLKLEYYLIYSRDKRLREADSEVGLASFITKCIRTYDLAVSQAGSTYENSRRVAERFPGDDAALLAVAALLRLLSYPGHHNPLLRAVVLLDQLVTYSPSNYEALSTLVLLYSRLGAGWLAAKTYNRLSIKNIQLPTLSWLLGTKISTIHPHSQVSKEIKLPVNDLPGNTADGDPIQHLTHALDYHKSLLHTDQQELLEFLDANQYASLSQAMGNTLHDQNGFVKYMLLTEWARIERLSGAQQKRDYRVLFAIAHTFDYVANGTESARTPAIYNVPSSYLDRQKSLTFEEQAQYRAAVECQLILRTFEAKRPDEQGRNHAGLVVVTSLDTIEVRQKELNERIATMRNQQEDYFLVITDEVIAPSWRFFHASYTGSDICTLIKKTLETVEAQNRKWQILDPQACRERISRLRKLCNELRLVIHAAATKLYYEFKSDQHHKKMVYSIIGRSTDNLEMDPIAYRLRDHLHRNVDSAGKAAQAFVERLCQAWCEALDNLRKLTSVP